MATEETVSRSTLEKPLQFLTEEDISQLTREDCRRYLKEKGMRRPSWNKSQAIQQVISLKRLLETTLDSGTAVKKKLSSTSRPHNPPTTSKSTDGDAPVIGSAADRDEPIPYRRKDLEKSDRGSDSVPPRTAGIENGPRGQMTIFYCGKVNVYDDVPAEKARTIMQLAASTHQLPKEGSLDESTSMRVARNNLHSANVKEIQESPILASSTTQAGDMNDSCLLLREDGGTFREDNHGYFYLLIFQSSIADGSCSRKASVQRYLEKRKDRFKSKTKVSTSSSVSLDIYNNHAMGNQIVEDLSNRSDTCSSPQIKPPNTPSRCSHFGEQ